MVGRKVRDAALYFIRWRRMDLYKDGADPL